MKLEIELDATTSGDLIGDTLKSLPPQKKEDLCAKIIEKWLSEPHNSEREVFAAMIRGDGSCNDYNGKFDQYKFDHRMRTYKSSRDKMVEEISSAAVESYQSRVKDLIENDEQLKEKFSVVRNQLLEAFPNMVQKTMVEWFSRQFKDMTSDLTNIYGDTYNTKKALNEVRTKLGLNEIENTWRS
jgi:hypothetical protein